MTAYLSPEDYGMLAIVLVLVSIVSSPLFIGFTAYINVEYFNLNEEEHKKLVSTLIKIPFMLSLPFTAIFYIYYKVTGEIWSIPAFWFISIPILALFTLSYRILLDLFRVKEQAYNYGLLEVFFSLFQFSLAIMFVVIFNQGLDGRLWSVFVSSCIIAVVSLFILYKGNYISHGFDYKYIKGALKYGLALIPHELSGLLVRLLDRFFIITILGSSAAGLYAVAAQVASIGLIVLSVFNLAWQPYVFKCLSTDSPQMRYHLVKLSRIAFLGFVIFFLVLNNLTPYIYEYFINDLYLLSQEYVRWLLLGFFFLAIYTIFCDYIFYAKKTYLLSITSTANLLLVLIMNYYLVPLYGAIGSAYAFSISSAISCIVIIIFSNLVLPMPWLKINAA